MKKSLWMLGAAVTALTSCTQSEVLDISEGRRIGFETHVEKSTRANTDDIVDAATDGFQEFYVYGAYASSWPANNPAVCLNGVKVKGGKGNWSYENHASWIADRTFRFAAYANGKGDGIANAAKLDGVTFVSHEEVSDGSTTNTVWGLDIVGYQETGRDLIAAVPEQKVVGDITTAPPSVGLTFKHILAKVIIQFRTTNTDASMKMQISNGDDSGITFSAKSKGNCEVRYTGVSDNTMIGATWGNQDVDKKYTFFADVENWNSGNIQQEYYVIPQSNTGITIPIIVVDTQNSAGEVTSSVIYEDVSLEIEGHENWLPGYVYRYIADITPGQHYIHFTTSVNTWVDEDDRNQGLGGGTQSSNSSSGDSD